jgi:toxin ParE1/3/4
VFGLIGRVHRYPDSLGYEAEFKADRAGLAAGARWLMSGADYRIAWRPKALEDLRSIVRYIAQDSPARARTFGKKLREKVQPLAQHPLLGHEAGQGCRPTCANSCCIQLHCLLSGDRGVAHRRDPSRQAHLAQQTP